MRIVLQRVQQAQVLVDGKTVGKIGRGSVVFLGVAADDTEEDLRYLTEKTINLRIFPDAEGKMNRSLTEINGELLVISQFTLYGDCRKGRRPSLTLAAPPDFANKMYEEFIRLIEREGVKVASGQFQQEMLVEISNEGPVTILLDSKRQF